MIPFNYIQRLSIAKVLIEIMLSDNSIADSESELFRKIAFALELSDEDILRANSLKMLTVLAELKKMPDSEKQKLGILMIGIIEADGIVSPEEIELFRMVCVMTNIPIAKDNNKDM